MIGVRGKDGFECARRSMPWIGGLGWVVGMYRYQGHEWILSERRLGEGIDEHADC